MTQIQKTDNQSISNQAEGNIQQQINYYNGLQEDQVRTLCLSLYEKNHKELVFAAQEKAKEEVNSYAVILFEELSKIIDEEITNKLKEPEIQAAINDTVKIVARKADRSDKGILSELIKEKIEKFEIEEESSIIDDAIAVMSSTTSSQMMLCTLIYIIRKTEKIFHNKTYTYYEENGFILPQEMGAYANLEMPDELRKKTIRAIFRNFFISDFKFGHFKDLMPIERIGKVNLDVMSMRRLITAEKNYNIKIEELLKRKLFLEDNEKIEEILPEIIEITKSFGMDNLTELDNFILTPIGECIGANYARSKMKITPQK